MRHVAVDHFFELYEKLPIKVRKLADHNFTVIKEYPRHPLLRLLCVENVLSMRVGSKHRALGVEEGDTTIWFWIGKYHHYTAHFH